ncbi:MAG TPA: DUF4129 domain-containing protein [Actinobacteria bacterium]|nr:hypothetical protein BMS3Bbin01_01751 [bacterium BMS3Bbin01]HDH26181.1 DUF4129 domain-containing protein [Actinomycetota bacterium]
MRESDRCLETDARGLSMKIVRERRYPVTVNKLEPTPRWVVALLSLALLALLAVVAIGARRIPSATGDSQLPLDSRTMGQILTGAAWLVMVGLLIWLVLPGGVRRRKRALPKRRSWLASVLVLTVLLVVFMQLGEFTKLGKQRSDLTAEQPSTILSAPSAPDTGVVSMEPSAALSPGSATALLIVMAAVILAVVALSAIGRGGTDESDMEPVEEPAFSGLIDDLLAELDRSGDPRAVVIGAYARMEEALGKDGVVRRSVETPLEFLDRALRRLSVSGHAAKRLTGLFAEARFSPHVIDEGMSAEAIDALSEIRDELRARA